MKRVIAGILILLASVSVSQAATASWMSRLFRYFYYADDATPARVECSSNTYTEVMDRNDNRKGITIINPSSSVDVRLSTWPAAAAETNYITIQAGYDFSDNLAAYCSSWYVLTAPGNLPVTVEVLEKGQKVLR